MGPRKENTVAENTNNPRCPPRPKGEWNDDNRGRIPNYDPLQDKNCVMYQASLGARRRQPSQPGSRPSTTAADQRRKPNLPPRRPLRPISPRAKQETQTIPRRPGTIATSHRQQSALSELREHIIDVWKTFDIPEFHQELYSAKVFVPSTEPAELLHEAQRLASMTAPVQRVMRLCDDREYLLKRMKVFAKVLEDDPELFPRERELKELSDLLSELREVSLQLVAAIVKWRQQVAPPAALRQKFGHPIWLHGCAEGQPKSRVNYLLKMRTDTQWVASSSLSGVVEFSTKFDPFFVYPSLKLAAPSETKQRLRNIARPFIHLESWELNRVRKAEDVILIEVCSCYQRPPSSLGEHKKTQIENIPVSAKTAALRDAVAEAHTPTPTPRAIEQIPERPVGSSPNLSRALPSSATAPANEKAIDVATAFGDVNVATVEPEVKPVTITADELKNTMTTWERDRCCPKLKAALEAPDFDPPNEWYWVGDLGLVAIKLKKGAAATCLVTHISSSFENLPAMVKTIKEYIFRNIAVVSIRITLWYVEEGDSYRLDPEIEEVFKEHKFKWFTLTNTADRRRGQVYNCRRTEEDPPMPSPQSCIYLQVSCVSLKDGASRNNPSASGLLVATVIRSFELAGEDVQPSRVTTLASNLPQKVPIARAKHIAADSFDSFFEVFDSYAPTKPSAPLSDEKIYVGALAVELDWLNCLEWAPDHCTVAVHTVGISKSAKGGQLLYIATEDDDIFVVVIPWNGGNANPYDFASRALMECEETNDTNESIRAVRIPTCDLKADLSVGPLNFGDETGYLCEHSRLAASGGRKVCTLARADPIPLDAILDLTLPNQPFLLCIHHVSIEHPLHVVAA